MRPIDGDALEKYLSDAEIEAIRQRKYVFASALNTICGNVRNFPTIEPERRKGQWIVQTDEDRPFIWWKCSECGHIIFSESERDRKDFHAFCGRCGADMRG